MRMLVEFDAALVDVFDGTRRRQHLDAIGACRQDCFQEGFAPTRLLGARGALLRIEIKRDQLREHREHADDLGCVQTGRMRIDGAQRPEKGAVHQDERDRNVALEPISRGRRVMAEDWIFSDIVDDDHGASVTHVAAERRLDVQFATGLQAEIDRVQDGAGHPSVVGDPRDGRKSHSGRAAQDLEHRRHGIDLLDGSDIHSKRAMWRLTHDDASASRTASGRRPITRR